MVQLQLEGHVLAGVVGASALAVVGLASCAYCLCRRRRRRMQRARANRVIVASHPTAPDTVDDVELGLRGSIDSPPHLEHVVGGGGPVVGGYAPVDGGGAPVVGGGGPVVGGGAPVVVGGGPVVDEEGGRRSLDVQRGDSRPRRSRSAPADFGRRVPAEPGQASGNLAAPPPSPINVVATAAVALPSPAGSEEEYIDLHFGQGGQGQWSHGAA